MQGHLVWQQIAQVAMIVLLSPLLHVFITTVEEKVKRAEMRIEYLKAAQAERVRAEYNSRW